MKKSDTILFVSFLFLVLVFLTGINFFKDLSILNDTFIMVISVLLIILIILLFIYREMENARTLNQFITVIAHKIKTPVTGISWSIDMLQKDLTLLDKKDLLVEMKKANDRLMEVLDLLVSFAKFDKKLDYNPVSVSLLEVVKSSFDKNSAMIKKKNINFSINDLGGEFPVVWVDRPKIQFSVDMIIDNAVKYTPAGGSVSASFDVNDNSITLKVADTGIGMSFLDSKRLFSHFFRAANAKVVDSGGLGLGLYTARKIVSHYHGKLWAESKGINKGSTFYLRLPIKK